jgi:hypothetical protein
MNSSLKDKIKILDLSGIIEFMENEYEIRIQKAPEIESTLNG